jgi:hypothetical protein
VTTTSVPDVRERAEIDGARPPNGQIEPAAATAGRRSARWTIALSLCATVGIVLVGTAYSVAARRSDGELPYVLFWAGVLAFVLPAFTYATSEGVTRAGQVVALVAISLFLQVPKILRDPGGPLFHDELAHWRQLVDIGAAGHLFVPSSIIPIIQHFPGLHIVALTIERATGLSAWSAATAVLLITHVVGLVGVFLIVERVTGRARVGAIGAVVYALNSSYMLFHTQFAYESLAFALFVVVVLALTRIDSATGRGERRAWGAVAVAVGATVVPTHHLTSLVLVVVVVAWAATEHARARAGGDPRRRDVARVVTTVAVVLVAVGAAWVAFAAPETVSYLSPYAGHAVRQLVDALGGRTSSGTRQLFARSTTPAWEHAAAFVCPVLALGLVMGGAVTWWRRRPLPTTVMVLGALAATYFVSLPFIFASAGAEGARRSWGFSFIGVALVAAPFLAVLIARTDRSRGRDALTAVGLVAALTVATIGNVAAGLDAQYRFPGPFVYGSDTRSFSPELRRLAAWLHDVAGPGQRVVADRVTSLALAAFGDERVASPSDGFRTWDLWFRTGAPRRHLLSQLRDSGYRYLVIDTRAAEQLPAAGPYLSPPEPYSYRGDRSPIARSALDRFASYPWASKVWVSDHYVVYHLELRELGARTAVRR